MISWLLDYRTWLTAGIAFVIGAGTSAIPAYHFGQDSERIKWLDKERALKDQFEAEKRVLIAGFDKTNQTVRGKVNEEIAKLRADAAAVSRLRINARNCEQVNQRLSEALSAKRDDAGATLTWVLPVDTSNNLIGLAAKADEVVARCRGLQDWARENGFD